VLYIKAGRAPSLCSPTPLSLLLGEAVGSAALLTFVLCWALTHNFVHLF
jgi:hypothetical protein